MKHRGFYFFIGLIAVLAFTACSSTRKLPQDAYLLKKNKVKIEDKKIEFSTDANDLIIQQPNKKFLFIKAKLLSYSMAKTDSSLWARIGEPPVVYNGLDSKNSLTQLEKYFKSMGYFDVKTSYITDTVGKKRNKIIVNYTIRLGKPYSIRNINYTAEDPLISSMLLAWQGESLLKQGMTYNENIFKDERERITRNIQNEGYFKFTKNYITFQMDSSLNSHQIDLNLIIKNLSYTINDSNVVGFPHHRYKIDNIFIRTDYNPTREGNLSSTLDTILFSTKQYRSNKQNQYSIIFGNTLQIKPKRLTRAVYISTNNYFNLKDVEKTYSALRDFNLFQFININFTEQNPPVSDTSDGILNCHINLSRKKLHSISPSLELSNSAITNAPNEATSGTNLGMEFSMLYTNCNVFHGAENLAVKFKTAFEKSFGRGSSTPDDRFFNTYEIGGDVALQFPRFLFPIKQDNLPKYFHPKTTLTVGGDYQLQTNFSRKIFSTSLGYYLKPNLIHEHYLFPIGLNIIKMNPDSIFNAYLASTNDERFKDQYSDKFIMNLRYSFIYNTQDLSKIKNFYFVRWNMETAGNLLNLVSITTDAIKNSEGFYTLNGLQYAQYVRTDIEWKKYFMFSKTHHAVLRFVGGIGTAYSNSIALPYDRSFFAGGSNGLRAWRYRKLGPGGFNPNMVAGIDPNIDRTGDMMLSINAENRFTIYKYLEGALFTDMGNIWLLRPNSTFPEGEFKINKFYQQIAWDMGVGLRLNLSFFIVRLDLAIPITEPENSKGDRFVIQKTQFNDVLVNFGIGYPF